MHRLGNGLAVIPTVSPLRLGHLLVVPEKHHCSISQLNPVERGRVVEVVRALAGRFSSGEQTPLVFEHGLGQGSIGGCGISHAHLHVLPATPSEIRGAREGLSSTFSTVNAGGLDEAWSTLDSTTAYGLLGDPDDVLMTTADLASQSLRKCVAAAIGSQAWNWRELSDWPTMERTHAVLAG